MLLTPLVIAHDALSSHNTSMSPRQFHPPSNRDTLNDRCNEKEIRLWVDEVLEDVDRVTAEDEDISIGDVHRLIKDRRCARTRSGRSQEVELGVQDSAWKEVASPRMRRKEELQETLMEAYEIQREIKLELSKRQTSLLLLEEELSEVWSTILVDVQRMFSSRQVPQQASHPQHEHRFTGDNLEASSDEVELQEKQPELHAYVTAMKSPHNLCSVVDAVRECHRHLTLAELLVAAKYAEHIMSSSSERQRCLTAVTPREWIKTTEATSTECTRGGIGSKVRWNGGERRMDRIQSPLPKLVVVRPDREKKHSSTDIVIVNDNKGQLQVSEHGRRAQALLQLIPPSYSATASSTNRSSSVSVLFLSDREPAGTAAGEIKIMIPLYNP